MVAHLQVADTVAGTSSPHDGPCASGMCVADATPAAGLRTRERCHRTWEVMRLCSKQQVPCALDWGERPGRTGALRQQGGNFRALNCRGVVFEGDHGVVGVGLVGVFDEGEEGVWLRSAVDGDGTGEEPVPAVLAVGLRQVKELYCGGVALQILPVPGILFYASFP